MNVRELVEKTKGYRYENQCTVNNTITHIISREADDLFIELKDIQASLEEFIECLEGSDSKEMIVGTYKPPEYFR